MKDIPSSAVLNTATEIGKLTGHAGIGKFVAGVLRAYLREVESNGGGGAVSEAELAERKKHWKAPANAYQSGAIRKYAQLVGPAYKGAVTHEGGKAEVICYADI